MSNSRFMITRCTPSGHLDTNFGTHGGKTILDFPQSGGESAFALALAPGGKIVLAGSAHDDTKSTIALARFTSDGYPDPTLGPNNDGRAVVEIPNMEASARGLVTYPDGKIVVAGHASASPGTSQLVLARCYANGELDTTFGTQGMTFVDFGPGADVQGCGLRQDANGKLVVAGTAHTNQKAQPVLARCDADGHLDTTFASGGKTLPGTIPGPPNRRAHAFAINSSGQLVTVGMAGPFPAGLRVTLSRWLSDGQPAFLSSKDIHYTDATNEVASDVAIDASGRLVLAGSAYINGDQRAMLLRYHWSGSMDRTFGPESNGRVLTDFVSGRETFFGVAIDASGRLVAAGNALVNGYSRVALARFTANGLPDQSFGIQGNGKVLVDFPETAHEQAMDLRIDANGNILMAGWVADGGPDPFALPTVPAFQMA